MMGRVLWTTLIAMALVTGANASSMADNNVTNTNTTTAPTASPGSTQLCDAQLLFQKLYVLMPAINQCAMESDYFIKPSNLSLPSDASLTKYCNSKNCSMLSQELDNAGLPSCSVPVGNTTIPFKVFFKDIKDHCDSSPTSVSSAPSSPSNSAPAQTHTIPMFAQWLTIASVAIASVAYG